MNNFKIYYFAPDKVYLDGSASEGYSYQTAMMFARDNASSMPNKRIYVENGDTMQDVTSYINVNGRIITEAYN